MKKRIYLLILFIFSFGLLSNVFTSAILTKDVSLLLSISWCIIGFFYFPDKKSNYLNTPQNKNIAWILLASMLISMLTPWIYYNQNIIDTFFSQRFNYIIVITLLIFLRISPTDKDFLYVIKFCAYASIIGFIISIIYPKFYMSAEAVNNLLERRRELESTDIGFACPGYPLVPFYLFHLIEKILKKSTLHDIIEASIFMLYIIAVQNRSTIIGTLPFYCWGILFMKSSKKVFLFIFISIIISIILPFLNHIYEALSKETQTQLEDTNYNRWQSISLYLFEMKDNFMSIFFGNGVWSKSGDYLSIMVKAQENRGTYISDIGWLGAYFYYGLIPVIILLKFALKAILKKTIPLYIKFFSIWLIAVPTIHPYLMLTTVGATEFAMYFYLIIYYTKRVKKIDNNKIFTN